MLGLLLVLASCTGRESGGNAAGRTVTVGLFPNLTHAPAILCVEEGRFEAALDSLATGSDGEGAPGLHLLLFESGPQAVEAMFAGAVDLAYMGPSPAVNGYLRSDGEALRIVAGAASGGASLVVQPEITSVAQLRGTSLASPQLGNTQDIALRVWLAEQGLRADLGSSSDVIVASRSNAQIFEAFRARQLEGAWVPEPWASRLVVEAGGRVLVDERDLWPGGLFSTTVVVADPDFLESRSEVLGALLEAHVGCVRRLASSDPSEAAAARETVGRWIARTAGKALPAEVIDRAWSELTFTVDPLTDTVRLRAVQAAEMKLLPAFDEPKIAGAFELGPLRKALEKSTQGAADEVADAANIRDR